MENIYPDCALMEPSLGETVWIEQAPFSAHLKNEADMLYRNVFCSIGRFQNDEIPIRAYVNADEFHIKQIILFSQHRSVITVLSELLTISNADIEKFVSYIFYMVADVEVIKFPSVSQQDRALPYLYQSYNATEDIVLILPDSPQAYLARLSKNTKESIKRYQKRIARELNAVKFDFYERAQVDAEQIREVVRLNEARIRKKNQVPTHTVQTINQLEKMISEYGVTLVVTAGDAIIAGVICTLVRKKFYMHVLAHDPTFDGLRLGKICCYLSICDAIERGAEEYHMLSGEYEYKYRFLGERRDYQRLTVYRSHIAALKNFQVYAHAEIRGRGRRIKRSLFKWRDKWKH